MRFRSRKNFASIHTVPIGQASIEHTADNDIRQRPVVGVDAVALGTEDETWTVLSDQTGNRETGRNRVLKQTIALSEYQPFDSEYLRGARGIFPPNPPWAYRAGSPSVRSTNRTRRPDATSIEAVPPMDTSRSSGCAPKAITSNATKYLYHARMDSLHPSVLFCPVSVGVRRSSER